jgi:hypothetical protein
VYEGGVRGEDPRSDNTNSGKEQQSEWTLSRRGSWSRILGRGTTSFVKMYVLSSFTTIEYRPRPRVVVMLSPVSPSDFSIESSKCRAKIPYCVKALKRADIVLDWESGALFTTIVQLYPCGGPAVVTATCDNVRYVQAKSIQSSASLEARSRVVYGNESRRNRAAALVKSRVPRVR